MVASKKYPIAHQSNICKDESLVLKLATNTSRSHLSQKFSNVFYDYSLLYFHLQKQHHWNGLID